jgi:hypothetical protein
VDDIVVISDNFWGRPVHTLYAGGPSLLLGFWACLRLLPVLISLPSCKPLFLLSRRHRRV